MRQPRFAEPRAPTVRALPAPSPRDRFLKGARGAGLKQHAMIGHGEHFSASGEPVDWAWEGVLQRTHLALVAGPSGVGKTTLVALLVAALANPTGTPVEVLGRRILPAPEGTFVVLIEEENSRRSIAKKLAESCAALGLPVVEAMDRVVTIARAGMRIHASSREHEGSVWYDLLARARDGLVGALFLDSWATIVRGESNSEEAQAEAAGWLRDFLEMSGGPVLAVIHTRKSGAESIEDIAGSHQRAAAADVVMLVTAEKDDGRVLSSKVTFAKLRDGEGEHPQPVTFSVAVDEGAMRVAVDASARGEDRPAHERVYELVLREEKTARQIREALRMSGERVKQALAILKAEKRIQWSRRLVAGRETWFARAKGGDAALLREAAPGLFASAHEPKEVADDRPF